MVRINYKDLRRQIELDGPARAVEFICEGLRERYFTPNDFSLKRLAQYTIEDGHEFVESLYHGSHGVNDGMNLLEAAGGAVTTATFSNITGQIAYTAILEAYQDPKFIWPELCTTQPTQFSGEKIPGIGRMGEDSERVSEAEPYPVIGVSQEYIETPETIKRGMIVPVTKEAVFFDRTNLVLDRCREVGTWAGFQKEKEIIDIATGQANNYKRNGTARNTYLDTATLPQWDNTITDVLADWSDLEAAYLLFDGMVDFTTGEPILIMPDTLIVPSALRAKAMYILNSTEVRGGTSNTTAYQTIGTDPMKNIMPVKVVTNQMVYARTSSAVKWWIGQPKKAFKYMENWGFTPQQAGANSEKDFERDILYQFKISWRGVAAVVDPLYMVYSAGSG